MAQPEQGLRPSNWELNLHAAALRAGLFDESAGTFQFGARVFRNFGNGLSLGGNFDWARPEDITVAPFAGLNASLLLYSAEIEYGFRASPRTVVFLGAGIGAASLSLDQVPVGGAEKSTGLLIPAGGGLKFLNRAVAPSWALRFDVRDNVILLETLATDGGVETEPRHNLEGSVGFSFLFGGETERTIPDPDSDRDGVPDAEDFCLNRAGVAVDGRGCPLSPEPAPELEADPEDPAQEADADLDGVPAPAQPEAEVDAGGEDEDLDGVRNDVDACPGTPPGIPVDVRGCLARLDPAAEAEGEAPLPVPFPEPIDRPAGVEPGEPGAAAEPGQCVDSSTGERDLTFEGRRFEPTGYPQPVDRQFLVQVGSSDGIPLFVSDTAQKPYRDFWVPRCGANDVYELYIGADARP